MAEKGATVVSVNISEATGEKKHDVGTCDLLEESGLEGDAHAGDWRRQVSLLALESIDKMRLAGLDVLPGDFAENLTIQGLDVKSLPVGTRLKVGDGVILQITQIGKECHERCAIFYQAGDCVMPTEGVFARVLKGGRVNVGDSLVVVE